MQLIFVFMSILYCCCLCCPRVVVVVVVHAVLMSLLLLCPSYIYIVFSVSSAVSMLCTYGK